LNPTARNNRREEKKRNKKAVQSQEREKLWLLMQRTLSGLAVPNRSVGVQLDSIQQVMMLLESISLMRIAITDDTLKLVVESLGPLSLFELLVDGIDVFAIKQRH